MTTQKSYTATPGPTLIDGAGLSVVIDDYLSERHEARVSVSAHPVESGTRVSDHAVRDPYHLELVGYVSDVLAPGIQGFVPDFAALFSVLTRRGAPLEERATRAWAAILAAIDPPQTLDVITLLGHYTSMVITKADAPQDNTTGRGLLVTLQLDELQVAGSIVSLAAPAAVSGPAVDRADLESQQRVNPDSRPLSVLEAEAGVGVGMGEDEQQSVLRRIFGWIPGIS